MYIIHMNDFMYCMQYYRYTLDTPYIIVRAMFHVFLCQKVKQTNPCRNGWLFSVWLRCTEPKDVPFRYTYSVYSLATPSFSVSVRCRGHNSSVPKVGMVVSPEICSVQIRRKKGDSHGVKTMICIEITITPGTWDELFGANVQWKR